MVIYAKISQPGEEETCFRSDLRGRRTSTCKDEEGSGMLSFFYMGDGEANPTVAMATGDRFWLAWINITRDMQHVFLQRNSAVVTKKTVCITWSGRCIV